MMEDDKKDKVLLGVRVINLVVLGVVMSVSSFVLYWVNNLSYSDVSVEAIFLMARGAWMFCILGLIIYCLFNFIDIFKLVIKDYKESGGDGEG